MQSREENWNYTHDRYKGIRGEVFDTDDIDKEVNLPMSVPASVHTGRRNRPRTWEAWGNVIWGVMAGGEKQPGGWQVSHR